MRATVFLAVIPAAFAAAAAPTIQQGFVSPDLSDAFDCSQGTRFGRYSGNAGGQPWRIVSPEPFNGQNFKLEFTRTTGQGPRVTEIDAVFVPPPPGTVVTVYRSHGESQ